ncbi:hypothetical protein BABINDRAFT_121490 [Babjeviella inositovora NRRL Y-12698]|uniref:Uncharacterized protein n=1 Tax=Babjeviella inositovora NRRL Y-12698 TaxID=984486 RepID=A0A1E3QVX3_9ASCO|nr:uncharacterized protein BABINDRAFT_121490 [Babjeviella inositovora NRRL Y-12698]ODQ81232.1 hypothetical protein BABINDRAFT_121490 [Babjeviella inositovora NRRL Y-12698]
MNSREINSRGINSKGINSRELKYTNGVIFYLCSIIFEAKRGIGARTSCQKLSRFGLSLGPHVSIVGINTFIFS